MNYNIQGRFIIRKKKKKKKSLELKYYANELLKRFFKCCDIVRHVMFFKEYYHTDFMDYIRV